MHVPARMQRDAIRRAASRCEYCGLAQAGQEASFHIDHVIPVIAGGRTILGNLALACVSCSLRKGARQIARDPETGKEVPLFSPRHNRWREHFRWEGVRIVGRTLNGRATVEALKMNRPLALAIRREEAAHGRHPPPQGLTIVSGSGRGSS
jgi:hypothetical protein